MTTAQKAHHAKKEETPIAEMIDPVEAAKVAGLRYVNDAMPGIRRKRAGKNFSYIASDGRPIRDPEELRRIKALAIPPAWTDVWICANPRGHILATGRDAKGRKQYRYHPQWRAVRDETKYSRLIAFGEALPTIRERVDKDLALPGLPREKVLATVVRLLDTTMIRVGNEEYARENNSFGLTTLQSEHVDVAGTKIEFHFRGKSGKEHTIDVRDRQLAKIVKRCQDIPGHELFQYVDEEGEHRSIDSADVNEYLREISGQDFTAKDFRTWGGTIYTVRTLREIGAFETETQAKKNVVQAIKSAAEYLGNTPTICRKCYVHPAVLEAYLNRSLIPTLDQLAEKTESEEHHGLDQEEAQAMAFLKSLLEEQTNG
jgi:DNA topoisomerase-1